MISSRAESSVLLKSRWSRPPLSTASGLPSASTTRTRAVAGPEADGLLVQHVAADVVDELDVGDAVEVAHQRLGPGDLAVPWRPAAVAVGVERPHPLTVEEHVDRAGQ